MVESSLAWQPALFGGILIGISSVILLLFNGSVAGISGIFRKAITSGSAEAILFILGLVGGAALYEVAFAAQHTPVPSASVMSMVMGGLLVGVGTRLANGCTSGHGVCGLGFLSPRSLVAVLTFMATGILTVWIIRHSGVLP